MAPSNDLRSKRWDFGRGNEGGKTAGEMIPGTWWRLAESRMFRPRANTKPYPNNRHIHTSAASALGNLGSGPATHSRRLNSAASPDERPTV